VGVKNILTGMVIAWGLNSAFKTPTERGKAKNGWYLNFSHDWKGDVFIHAKHYMNDALDGDFNLDLSHIWREIEKITNPQNE
jgi:hypothetical protein